MKNLRSALYVLSCASITVLAFGNAHAVTLHGLKGNHLDDIYGTYAPRGMCKGQPRITVGDSGITFTHAGKSMHSGAVEHALSFAGPDYQGISRWIFPFPVNADDPGRVLMTFNAEEKSGALMVESNLGPGQAFTPLEAALVKHSPYAKCTAESA